MIVTAIRRLGELRARSLITGGLIGVAAVVGGAATAMQPPAASGVTPLDDDLLRDLLPSKKPAGPAEKSPGATKRPTPEAATPTPTPRPVVESGEFAEEGEDIGARPAARLKKIRTRMESVRRQLEQGDSSQATQDLQAGIVAEFDALLARLEQAGSKSPPPSGSAAATAQKPTATPQPPASKDATDSSQAARSQEAGAKTGIDAQELEREIWGQLPPQLREQLRNTVPERFLPGYEALIEAYYRRLSEQRRP